MGATRGRTQRSGKTDVRCGLVTMIARRWRSPRERTLTLSPGFPTVNRAWCGGDEGTRTPDPLLAKEVLSQLSYIPTPRGNRIRGLSGRRKAALRLRRQRA